MVREALLLLGVMVRDELLLRGCIVREELLLLGLIDREGVELLRGVTVRLEDELVLGLMLRVVELVIGFRVTVRLDDPTVERSLRMTGFRVVMLREVPPVDVVLRRMILPPELPDGVRMVRVAPRSEVRTWGLRTVVRVVVFRSTETPRFSVVMLRSRTTVWRLFTVVLETGRLTASRIAVDGLRVSLPRSGVMGRLTRVMVRPWGRSRVATRMLRRPRCPSRAYTTRPRG